MVDHTKKKEVDLKSQHDEIRNINEQIRDELKQIENLKQVQVVQFCPLGLPN